MNIEEALKRIRDIDRLQKNRNPEKTCFKCGCENCDDGNVALCSEWMELQDFLGEECKKLERMKEGIQNGLYGKCQGLIKQIDEKIKVIQTR